MEKKKIKNLVYVVKSPIRLAAMSNVFTRDINNEDKVFSRLKAGTVYSEHFPHVSRDGNV